MIVLDLFCGAGGAAMGYAHAGHDVIGVDIVRQPNFPFTFARHLPATRPLVASRRAVFGRASRQMGCAPRASRRIRAC